MRILLLAIFTILLIDLSAQEYQFENYNNKDGLAQSQAKTILQDHKGYLWIGTVIGLSQFDSHEFVNYYKKDGLIDNSISSLYEDDQNRLWVGMRGGIALKSFDRFRSFKLPAPIENFKILNILSTHSDTLILSTNGKGIVKFSIADGQYFFDETNVEYVRKTIVYNNQYLLTTPEGLWTVDGEFKNKKIFHEELSSVSITDVEIVGNELWVSTYKNGVYSFQGDKFTRYTSEEGLIDDNVRNIESDSDGKIWFATINGISCFDEDKFVNFDASNGLSYPNIEFLTSDRSGNLWLASKGQGIFRFSGWLFTSLNQSDNIHSDIIMSICEDDEKNIWYGSYKDGIARISTDNELILEPELGFSTVWSSLVDHRGKVWFGTTYGLKTYDNGEITDLRNESIFSGRRVTALHQDSNNIIWIGHKDGLSSYDGIHFKHHGLELGIPISRVRSIIEDDGILWIGSENGIYQFDGSIWSHYDEGHGLSDNEIQCIKIDSRKRLWIGTKSGLDVMENDRISKFDFESKQNDPVSILHLIDNKLVIGSNYGIHLLQLEDSWVDRPPFIRHFNRSSGLPDLECNLNANYQIGNEELLIGTSNGLVSMNLELMSNLKTPPSPEVHINGLRIFMLEKDLIEFADEKDNSSGLYKNLKLNSTDNHVTFDFTGICYASPNEVRYKYKLIGADADWLPPTKSNFATYSYLPHGEYTLELIAADNNSPWSEISEKFSFSIRPPYYLQKWFLALSALVLILLGYALFSWRKSLIKKKNETELIVMRSKMLDLEQQSLNSSMNRHFIFNALNSIQYYINREDKRSANTYLTNFAKLIRKNLDSTENNWTSLKDELERIELYLSMEHMRFKDKFEYKINISSEIDVNHIEIPPMLFQPFLENSIWHGILPKESTGLVILDIEKERDLVKITISDDGIGLYQSRSNKNGQIEHDSKGMDIINNRIKLFGKMTEKNFEIIGPKDVYDNNGVCAGTIVEILMPIVQGSHLN